MKTLILYSSVDGHTQHICQFIADKLAETEKEETNKLTKPSTRQIQLQSLAEFVSTDANNPVQNPDFKDIDTIIIGASIRYGKHRPAVYDFINNYKAEFAKRNIKTAFFSVNLVARKPDKNTADTNSYVVKFLTETNWQADMVDVFAGKLDYSIYGLFDKLIIKLIMKLTKGATSSDKPIVYTDWDRVDVFVKKVGNLTNQN